MNSRYQTAHTQTVFSTLLIPYLSLDDELVSFLQVLAIGVKEGFFFLGGIIGIVTEL